MNGVWPNWLWRTLRVREVPGSSPGTPTKLNFFEQKIERKLFCFARRSSAGGNAERS